MNRHQEAAHRAETFVSPTFTLTYAQRAIPLQFDLTLLSHSIGYDL